MADDTRIDFERSGGVANVKLRATIDGDSLSSEEAAELERALGEQGDSSPGPVPPPIGPGADRYQFDIRVTRRGEQRILTFREDDIPPAMRSFIDRLVDLARRPAGGA